MIAPPSPTSHDELEALIKEARARQLRRRLLGAAGVAIAAALGLSVYALVTGGSVDVAQPSAHGGTPTAPLCRSNQLAGSLFMQGATRTLAGGIDIRNTSGVACALPTSRPKATISWHGRQLSTREEPLGAPAGLSSAPVLAPGAKASVFWQWFSCGGPGPRAAVRPTFRLRFEHDLVVTARSSDLTPAFCGGLGGRRTLAVSRALAGS
jgi:hypothetical protein